MIRETKRCIIREMTEDDLEGIYYIYSGKGVSAYIEALYEDPKEEREFIRSYIKNAYEFYGYGTWVIWHKESKKLIGRVGFNLREGYEEPELGFVIAEEYQGQGYAAECCRAVMEVGKKEYEFNRIQTLIKEGNISSISLCKRLGFQYDKRVIWDKEEYLRFVMEL